MTKASWWTPQRGLLAFFVLAGLLLRLPALNGPVTYDEAYTYIGFASHSLWGALSDYSLPNNHILHSVLVFFSTSALGNQAWALRLPALLAGLALIPGSYLLGRRIYSPQTGLLTAALTAALPALIRFSTEARGYSMLAGFTLLIFFLGHELLQTERWRNWALLALGTALGFFTLPLMLYPAGGLYLWLALEGHRRRSFFLRWLGSGALAGALTVAFYLPALRVSGWRKIIANGFVQPVEAGKYFDWVLTTRLKDTWASWTANLPAALTVLLVLGFFLALILHRRIQLTRWPLALTLAVWVAVLVLARRPEAFDRFWSWLLAPCLLWAAAGLVETARKVRVGKFSGAHLLLGLAVAGLSLQLAISLAGLPQAWVKVGNPQASARFLSENLREQDVVLVGYPNNSQVWYYLTRLGVPATAWQPRADGERYWLLLASNQKDQTLVSIVRDAALDPALLDLPGATLVTHYGKIEIYLVLPAH